MQPQPNLTGIVLAGGLSSRMGTPKGLLKWNGKTLAEHAANLCHTICDQVLISANSNDYNFIGFPVIHDEIPQTGPMSGLLSCMKISGSPLNLLLSCDMPLISNSLIRHLLSFSHSGRITVPRFQGQIEPLCTIYPSSILTDLQIAADQRKTGLQSFILRHDPIIIDIDSKLPFHHPQMFLNINTEADFKMLISGNL